MIAGSGVDVCRNRRGAIGAAFVLRQINDLALWQPRQRPVQKKVETPVEAAWLAFQQAIEFAFALRRSEKLPMIDDVDIGTLADAHRTVMRPQWNRQRFEGGEYAHQLPLAINLAYACTSLSIDRARQAAYFCKSGQGKQTMTEPVFCRETNECVSCLALGRENAERFSQLRDAAIGKRRDIDTRNGVR